MILRYSMLQHKPSIFKAMTGVSVALFDELVWDLEPGYAQATTARRERPGRKRAVGAGHPCCLTARDEFLLTVIWLRHYFTQEALGYFFGVSDTTAPRAIGRVLPVPRGGGPGHDAHASPLTAAALRGGRDTAGVPRAGRSG